MQEMEKRAATGEIKRLLNQFPAVVLIGPRQSGKTTLAKSFKKSRYFDLEKTDDRVKLDALWSDLLLQNDLIILDEAHADPSLFLRLRSAIDEKRKKNGRFLLLGSVSPALMKEVGESLAGRMGIYELTPFTVTELPKRTPDQCWVYGGFPDGGVLRSSAYPKWQDSYLQLMAQRDLPHWGISAKPNMTQRLFKMMAALNGEFWNASEVGANLGLNYHTVNSYLDYLEGAFLIRRLPPYFTNIKKRMIKSPRVYWRDSGLLHSLLGLTPQKGNSLIEQILVQPWVGKSWEGWVIEQVLASLNTRGKKISASFFRTSDDQEVDLVLEVGSKLWAIEVKLSASPTQEMVGRLHQAADWIGATHRMMISRTKKTIAHQNFFSTNIVEALKLI